MTVAVASTTIETRNLKLAPLRKAHPILISWLNNKELMRFSENRHVHHTIKSEQEYIDSFDWETAFIWSIDHYESDRIIGNINAFVDPYNRIADMGILIGDSRYQGAGLGVEAWSAVINWLFSTQNIRKVEAGCMAVNGPMIGIFKATSMEFESQRKAHFIWEGTNVALVQYGRFA